MKEFLYFLKQWPGAIISFFAQKRGGGGGLIIQGR